MLAWLFELVALPDLVVSDFPDLPKAEPKTPSCVVLAWLFELVVLPDFVVSDFPDLPTSDLLLHSFEWWWCFAIFDLVGGSPDLPLLDSLFHSSEWWWWCFAIFDLFDGSTLPCQTCRPFLLPRAFLYARADPPKQGCDQP